MVKGTLRKNRRRNRTSKMQKGGGFFDDLKNKLGINALTDKAGNLFSFFSGKTSEKIADANNTIDNAKKKAECIKICMGNSEISSNLDSTKKTETKNLTTDNNKDVKLDTNEPKSDNSAFAMGGSKKRRRKSKKKKKGRKKRRKTRHR